MSGGRQCQRTGVWLRPAGREIGFRVAKTKHGPIGGPTRLAGTNTLEWNRYDSPGRTTYIAGNEVTAFTEVLGSYARPIGSVGSQFDRDALALGMTVPEYRQALAADENERPFLASGYLPEGWRDAREMYEVVFPSDAWLIEIEDANTVQHLRTERAQQLSALGCHDLTNADLRGESRVLTTMIATYLRDLKLDTEQPAAGLQYGSKRTGGWARAIWLGDDSAEDGQFLQATSGEPLYSTRPSFVQALNLLGLHQF